MKRMVMGVAFGLALLALPQAARAQQHHEHAAPKAAAKAHMENPARTVIGARAELKLTDDQVKKLEAIALRMDAHHKSMSGGHGASAHGAGAHGADKHEMGKSENQIHKDFFAIFTEDQLVEVKKVMAAHHAGMHPKKD